MGSRFCYQKWHRCNCSCGVANALAPIRVETDLIEAAAGVGI